MVNLKRFIFFLFSGLTFFLNTQIQLSGRHQTG